MNTLSKFIAAVSISVFSMAAFAEAPADAPKKGDGPGHHKMHDCSKIEDAAKKTQCETRQAAMKAAMEKCKGLEKEAHHQCMKDALPKKDK